MAGNQLMSGLCEPMPGIDTRIVAATLLLLLLLLLHKSFNVFARALIKPLRSK